MINFGPKKMTKTAAMRRFLPFIKKLFIKNPQVNLNLTLGLLQMKTEARIGFANAQKGYFITGIKGHQVIYILHFQTLIKF